MSLSTLLEIITQVCDEMTLTRPTTVVGNSDTQVRQLLAFASKSGRELLRAHPWSALITLGTITTVSGTSSYAVPSDFDRLVSETEWDSTNHWRTLGPDTSQVAMWKSYSALSTASVRRSLRLLGSNIVVFPTPSTNGDTIVYDYISTKWAAAQDSTAQTGFEADTDTSVYDPELMVMAVKFRFMSAKGFDANALFLEYNNRLRTCIAKDLGGPTINANGADETAVFLSTNNIPDSGFG